MEAACRNELKYVERRESGGLYSAYYLPDKEIVNRIAAQCKRDFSSRLGVIGNDSGLIVISYPDLTLFYRSGYEISET